MMPIVDGLEAHYEGQIAFRRIDANQGDGPRLVREHSIPGHPTILIIDQAGRETHRLLGPQPAEDLDRILQQLLMTNEQ